MRLNRYDFTSAGLIEQMISQYIINKFDPTLLCLLWECKANRLLKSGNYKEAFISFTKLIKYSQNHALIQATFNFHLQIAKIYFVIIVYIYIYIIIYRKPRIKWGVSWKS